MESRYASQKNDGTVFALEPRIAWKLSNVVLRRQAGRKSSPGCLVTPVFSTNYGSLNDGLNRRPVTAGARVLSLIDFQASIDNEGESDAHGLGKFGVKRVAKLMG